MSRAQELHQLSLEQFGPRLPELPWTGAHGAERGLDSSSHRQLARARRILDKAWLDDPLQGVLKALGSVVRGALAIHGPPHFRVPSWIVHDLEGQRSASPPSFFRDRRIDVGAHRRYTLSGWDPFAERPVNLSTLAGSSSTLPVSHEVVSRLGLHHQLRVVLYDGRQNLQAFVGAYLPKEEASYTLAEHRLLHAFVPDLRRWVKTARTIGLAPLDDTGLTAALEANPRPAYLLRDDGVIVFANGAARELSPDRLTCARPEASRVRLRNLQLVTLPAPDPSESRLLALPKALVPVAEGLARGLSDKELADELGLPIQTLRTYVKRAFERLGVSSRRELMRPGRSSK